MASSLTQPCVEPVGKASLVPSDPDLHKASTRFEQAGPSQMLTMGSVIPQEDEWCPLFLGDPFHNPSLWSFTHSVIGSQVNLLIDMKETMECSDFNPPLEPHIEMTPMKSIKSAVSEHSKTSVVSEELIQTEEDFISVEEIFLSS